jgi:glycine/serine hydroxymethyltransferase
MGMRVVAERAFCEADPLVAALAEQGNRRQSETISLIRFSNSVSRAALEARGRPFTNRYSGGDPGSRLLQRAAGFQSTGATRCGARAAAAPN